MSGAHVYRFRGKVAVHIGNGETVYLPPRVARQIADALKECAEDINRRAFVESTFNTKGWEFEGNAR